MRARRSRSQHARRWERGRPARNLDHAKKTYPSKEGWGGVSNEGAHGVRPFHRSQSCRACAPTRTRLRLAATAQTQQARQTRTQRHHRRRLGNQLNLQPSKRHAPTITSSVINDVKRPNALHLLVAKCSQAKRVGSTRSRGRKRISSVCWVYRAFVNARSSICRIGYRNCAVNIIEGVVAIRIATSTRIGQELHRSARWFHK